MSVWAVPALGRVIGASHQRQGKPCQDAVLARGFCAGDGEVLQLMAVADGHGGARYHRSDVGSRLACEQVAAVISDHLANRSLRDPDWDTWLQQELPQQVQRRWLRAIEADWQQQPSGSEPFSALSYGTTLGVVLMCRYWWAAGGLGDWDLLAVPANGPPELLNQEPELDGGSEATASLCLDQAPALWRQRCQRVPLAADQPPLTLLLSSDGLRKSCATDEDYRVLGAYLCSLAGAGPDLEVGEEPADLEAALQRITREGSGDDISVAIGRLGADTKAPTSPVRGGNRQRQRLDRNAPAWKRLGPGLRLLGLLGLAGAIGLTLWRWQRPVVPSAAERGEGAALAGIDQRGRDALSLKSKELCGLNPDTRLGTLRSRRDTFEGLKAGRLRGNALLQMAAEDPLGSLIAWSQPQGPAPTLAAAGTPMARPLPAAAAGAKPAQLAGLAICTPLVEDLRRVWADLRPAQPLPRTSPPSPPPAARSPR